MLGRGERIRTSGLYVPNVALYQAKLHPDYSRWRRKLFRHAQQSANNEARKYIKRLSAPTMGLALQRASHHHGMQCLMRGF